MFNVKLRENSEVGRRDPILKNQLLIPFFSLHKEVSKNQDRAIARRGANSLLLEVEFEETGRPLSPICRLHVLVVKWTLGELGES